jgi:2-amino-4-hydroxy-6-hydroxymethyldihydropteridine diphosphokinase
MTLGSGEPTVTSNPRRWESAHIALGSNLGDRQVAISSALAMLRVAGALEVAAVSPIIETEPVGPPGQGRYLNGAAAVRTTLSPERLLDHMLRIERELGRDRAGAGRNGPRTIDLDLLLYADVVCEQPGLTLPHPRMHQRGFVLAPLRTIAPQVVHPVLRQTVAELHERLLRTTGEGETASLSRLPLTIDDDVRIATP